MMEEGFKKLEDCSSTAAYYAQFGIHTMVRLLRNDGYDREEDESQLKEWYHFEDGSMLTIIDGYETFVDE